MVSENPDQRRLLSLQEKDTVIDQLVHRRAQLPQRNTISEGMTEGAALKASLDAAGAARDSVAAELALLEAEASKVEARVAAINARLYGTSAVSPKDAQAMADEVAQLKTRQSALEDEELETMEQLEPRQREAGRLEAEARELAARVETARSALQAGESEIDVEIEAARAVRDREASQINSALITEYESLRKHLGGIAVAEVEGDRCGGCHLTLSSGELDRIRKASLEEVVHCEECGRRLLH